MSRDDGDPATIAVAPEISAPTAVRPALVSVHAVALDVTDDELAHLEATLSTEERRRADALSGAVARRRFVADHGLRRRTLGERLAVDAAAVEYAIDPEGKPHPTVGGLHFSASRAGDVALHALCETAPLGVDVEGVFDEGDLRGLAGRLLSARERAAWETLGPGERARALTACWTRKEAHGKALGSGLVFPLSRIEAWAGDDRAVRCGDVEIRRVGLGARILDAGDLVAAVAVALGPGQTVSVAVEQP